MRRSKVEEKSKIVLPSALITPKEGREILYPDMEREDVPDVFLRKSALVPFDFVEPKPGVLPGEDQEPEPENEQEDGNGKE